MLLKQYLDGKKEYCKAMVKIVGAYREGRIKMSKICTACGAINTDNATICSRCTRPLPVQGNRPIENRHINVSCNPIKVKVLPVVGAVALLCVLVLVVIALIKGSAPSETWLVENIPIELLTYEYDSILYTSTVESMEIERRNTEDGVDDVYCIIVLKDDMMKRTAYIEMISRKYSQGGWILESWSEYQPEEGVPLQGLEEDFVYSYLNEEKAYTGLYGCKEQGNLETGMLLYSCDVNEQHEYVTTSGSVVLKAILESDVDRLPHSYYWYFDTDSSGVTVDWNLEGDFGCEPNGLQGKYFDVSVSTDSEMVDWNVEYGIYEFRLGGGYQIYTYKGEGTDVIPEWSGAAAEAELKIPLTKGYYLLYTKDSVWMLNSTTAFPSENELVRK